MEFDTNADRASTHWKVFHLLHTFPCFFNIIVNITGTADFACSMICPCSLESHQWLNDSCTKKKQNVPSFCLTPLSIIFTFVSITIAWHLLALPATSLTAAFILASGHPGTEIKILSYCILYSKVHKTTTTSRGDMHVTMYARHVTDLHNWTHKHVCIFESSQLEGLYIGVLLVIVGENINWFWHYGNQYGVFSETKNIPVMLFGNFSPEDIQKKKKKNENT